MKYEYGGKTYRLENQSPAEMAVRNSCEGCVFDVHRQCTQAVTGVVEVDHGCTGEHVHMVWKAVE